MKRVTDEAGLDAAIEGPNRVAVLFHATWCPFCRKFRPVFERLVDEKTGFEPVEAVIDDEENPLWARFGLDVVPAVVLFDAGRQIGRVDGALGVGLTERDLRRVLDDAAKRTA